MVSPEEEDTPVPLRKHNRVFFIYIFIGILIVMTPKYNTVIGAGTIVISLILLFATDDKPSTKLGWQEAWDHFINLEGGTQFKWDIVKNGQLIPSGSGLDVIDRFRTNVMSFSVETPVGDKYWHYMWLVPPAIECGLVLKKELEYHGKIFDTAWTPVNRLSFGEQRRILDRKIEKDTGVGGHISAIRKAFGFGKKDKMKIKDLLPDDKESNKEED